MSIFNLIPWYYKAGAIILLIIGVFAFGYSKGEQHTQAKFDAYKKAQAEQVYDFEKINKIQVDALITKYVDRIQTIKEKEIVYVDAAKNKVPDNFVLSNGFVSLHDAAATNEDRTTDYSNATPSGIKANEGLATIVSNYSICYQNKAHLESLQEFINNYNESVDKVNTKKKHFWDRNK